jgi:methyl-accepting chemotaxis protein
VRGQARWFGPSRISRQALREQGTASTDIARNVERIAQMAEQNSSAVRDTAGTARRLEDLAQQLRAEVSHFRI